MPWGRRILRQGRYSTLHALDCDLICRLVLDRDANKEDAKRGRRVNVALVRLVDLHGLDPEVVVGEPEKIFTSLVTLEATDVAEVICIPVPVSRVPRSRSGLRTYMS